jgi:hypothetical protein
MNPFVVRDEKKFFGGIVNVKRYFNEFDYLNRAERVVPQ